MREGRGLAAVAVAVLTGLLVAAVPAPAAVDVSVPVRAGDPLYRELRLAADLGLLAGPLPERQPLSRAEIFRLLRPLAEGIGRGTGMLPVPADPSRGITSATAARLARLRDFVNPWDLYWEDGVYPVTFDVNLTRRLSLEGSDVRRGLRTPHDLDYGYDRTEGVAFARDGSLFLEGEGLALAAYGRLRVDRDAVTYRPLVLALRAGLGNLRFTLGREPVAWGPEAHGGLLLSTNARPLDQLRVESESPFRLPGPLRRLGDVTASVLVGRLDDPGRADFPSPWLVGARATLAPTRWFVMGFQRTTMLGGEGSGFRLTGDTFLDLLLQRHANRTGSAIRGDTDHKAAVDWSLYLWPLLRPLPLLDGGRLYGTYGGEDSPQNGPLPSAPGSTYGIELVARGVLLRAEASNVLDDRNLWYWHRFYTDGYTYRGRVLGHPMGGDSRAQSYDLELPLGRRHLLAASFLRQEHGFRALPGVPGSRLREGTDVPHGVEDTFVLAVERFLGNGMGYLRLEGRALREWGDPDRNGPLESWGMGLTWRR